MSDIQHSPQTEAADTAEILTGAEIVVRCLVDQGVDVLFGYPGGAVLPIYDALFHEPRLHHVLVRHEQGAAHAAEGYARSTGRPGVVLVTSGPGATNTITGIVDALMDSIPLVVLTGQVPTHLIGSDAFQEADTVGITRTCTKHNILVKRAEDLPRAIHEAFHIAVTGRPGPVLVDIPKDVQFARAPYQGPKEVRFAHVYAPRTKADPARIREAVALIAGAERPLFYTGGGIINAGPRASALLRDVNGLPTGKMPLRDLYDLYPQELPAMIRDRTKVPFGEGAGLDVSPQDSAWKRRFNETISDADLSDGQKEFDGFSVQSKEELFYLRKLSQAIDVTRVPHLRDRAWISFPVMQHLEKLKAHAHFSL